MRLDLIPHPVDGRAMHCNTIRIYLNPILCKQSMKSKIQYRCSFYFQTKPSPISILTDHAVLQIGHVQILHAIFSFLAEI